MHACRKMEYQHTQAFRAIVQQLAPHAASIAADELPSLLWAASTLVSETPAPGRKAAGAGTGSSTATSSSSSSSLGKVPQNDGVIGAVNSSRIAELPEVVQFMLGASQVLSGGLYEHTNVAMPAQLPAGSSSQHLNPNHLPGSCTVLRTSLPLLHL